MMHTQVSETDIARLLAARQNHSQRAFTRAMNRTMAKYSSNWKSLSPAAKAAVQAALNASQQGAVADFGQFNSAGTLAAELGGVFPSQGTCAPLPQEFVSRSADSGINAGASLALSGQAGSWTLTASRIGQYQTLFGATAISPNLAPGQYTLTGAGGSGVNAFSSTLNVGGNISWTNKSAISTVDRSQPLTVTWSGGTIPGYALIGGYANSNTTGLVGFVCVEDTSVGTFTVPSFILSLLPASTSEAGLFISPHPLAQSVTIPGIDLAYFMDSSRDSKPVIYQ
jgi:hypothetical protein